MEKDTSFYGLPVKTIENEHLRLDVLAEAGPRIVRLFLSGSDLNLLAEVPDGFADTVNGRFHFRGGHRLWHAPEQFNRTYVPDSAGLTITEGEGRVCLKQPIESQTGIGKAMVLELDGSRAAVTIHHELTNHGVWTVELAPWGITQLRLGGTAVFPQQVGPVDADGLLPNRHLVLWPYTNIQDPRLQLGNEHILIKADPVDAAFKIGSFNRTGWLAYFVEDLLFCKRFAAEAGATYPDTGCNAEIYANHQFIELESLAPLRLLAPSETVRHTEVWELYGGQVEPRTAAEVVLPFDV
ncbi:MAG: hypothetical protein AAF614_22420 [Chloroflexota bacterium]